MRFQKHSSPVPYLNRADQWRMMGMCGMLLLVVLAINEARQPENWSWFFGSEQHVAGTEDLREIDFRVRDQTLGTLKPDEFVLVDAPPEPTIGEWADSQRQQLEQFDRDRLQGVQDQRMGFLRSEQPALDALVDHVRATPLSDLHGRGDASAGYRVVNVDPDLYRGKLIQLEGVLRQYLPFEQGRDGTGKTGLFQGWLFTEDSGNNPWLVLCVEPSPAIPLGERIEERVKVSGYFYKRYGYPTATGMHVAPLLVARQFEQLPRLVPQPTPAQDLGWYVAGFLGVVGGCFGWMVWRFKASDRKFARSQLARIAEQRRDASAEALHVLGEIEGVDPSQLQFPQPPEPVAPRAE